MAENNLTLKVSAEVTDLVTKLAVAKSSVGDYSAEVRRLAAQAREAGDAIDSGLKSKLESASVELYQQKQNVAALSAELRKEIPEGFLGGLAAGLEHATKSAEELHARVGLVSGAVGAFSELALAGFGLEKAAEAVNEFAETGEQLAKLSQITGMSAEELSALRVVAIETGTGFDVFGADLTKMSRAIAESITNPSSNAADALRAMSVQTTDSSGQMRPMADILQELANKLDSYQGGINKSALESAIFGRSGTELDAVLRKLADEGIEGAIDKSKALGQSWSDEQARSAEEFEEHVHDLSLTLEGLANTVLADVLPTLDKLAQGFEHAFGESSIEGRIDDTKAKIAELTSSIAAYEDKKTTFRSRTGRVETIDEGGGAPPERLLAELRQAQAELASLQTQAQAANAEPKASPLSPASVAAPALTKPPPAGGVDSGSSGGDAGAAAAGAEAAREAERQKQEEMARTLDTSLSIDKTRLSSQQELLSGEVTLGQITADQKIQQEIKLADQIYALENTELDQKAALYAKDSTQYAAALDQKRALEVAHQAEILKLNQDAAIQAQRDTQAQNAADAKAATDHLRNWQAAIEPVSKAFDTSINGVITGTETLRQAEAKAAQSIALTFMNQEEQKLAKFLATKAAEMTATTTSEAAQIAATEAGAAAGKAAQNAGAHTSILTDAKQAAAGAYAAVSSIPVVGPFLAPAAAASAFAGVMAFDVASAEGGMGSVPYDGMLTELHRAEMVLPANIANPMREQLAAGSFGGGGGGDITNNYGDLHAHFHGVGGTDEERLMKSVPKFAKAIGEHWNKNPSARPKY